VEWVVFAVVAVSVVVLALIIWPVSRQVRAETGMDPDVEAQLLLGETPVDEQPTLDTDTSDNHRDFDPGELRALQEIGRSESGKRSKRRR
jgi:hypothetical protein